VHRIEQKKKLIEPMSGADEISQLDQAFHEMDQLLQLAAEKERALFDNSSDIICVLNGDLNIEKINPACLPILGYKPDELIGKNLSQLTADSLTSEHFSNRTSEAALLFELQMKTIDAQIKVIMWSATWGQKQNCWYCVLHDISQQKKNEQEQRALVNLIVSDFEQPLKRISSLIKQIGNGSLGTISASLQEKISGATHTVPRLVSLVQDLLQIEHLQSTDLIIEHTLCNSANIIEDACRDVEAVAQARGITIQRQTTKIQWQVDEGKIMRVLINLLSNAIKFSPDGSAINVISRIEGEDVLVEIIDKGRGIPNKMLSSLFQTFTQTEISDGQRGKGTGLGLVICKRIVEQHGGEIGVSSIEGSGSTFWFRIPRNKTTSKHSDSALKAPIGAFEPKQSKNIANSAQIASKKNISLFSNWSLNKKGLFLIAVPLVFEIIFMVCMLGGLMRGAEELHKQIHDQELTAKAIKLTLSLASVGYSVGSLLRDPDAQQKCRQNLQVLSEDARAFKDATFNDSAAAAAANQILPALSALQKLAKEITSTNENIDYMASANEIISTTNGVTTKIEPLLDLLEQRQESAAEQQNYTRLLLISILTAGLAINFIVSIGLAAFFSRDIVSRLLILSDNARRFAEQAPLNQYLSGQDELAQLDNNFHATAEKIAEQRRRERAFLDNAHSIICALDRDGVFLASNPAAVQILGHGSEQLSSLSLFDLIDEEESIEIRKRFEESKRSASTQQVEMTLQSAMGDICLLWSIAWSDIEKSYFCVGHDITVRKNLGRLKKEFIALVTHDLRSPISAISSLTKIALYGVYGALNHEVEDALKQIGSESDKIAELVNDILDLEKLDAGKLSLQLQEVEAKAVLDKCIDLLKSKQSEAILLLASDSQAGILMADSERLTYALVGLLNQLLACQPAEISLCSHGNELSEISMSALDCKRELIFRPTEPDYPNVSTDSSVYGSRIRLPLSYRLTQAHGGTISVEQRGTNVFLKIAFRKSTSHGSSTELTKSLPEGELKI
jgi:PAS domain S-box-containing protein